MKQPVSGYYGKYRATVANNLDPLKEGRIQVIVPDVNSVALSTWALPCLPAAGKGSGLFTVPEIGARVWVEFEQGDPDYPIWTGCFWGSTAELPPMAHAVPPGVPGLTFQTLAKNGLQVSDTPGPTGGIQIRSTTGATIMVNDTGIIIDNGKGARITMMGPTVDINSGALTIT
ncbi:MAG: phage baseplate assembly protein V [Desulfosarcinaceae bacterium]|nr:phage baseplate assembly protein V [Desulfosarcinaceae bacterium]